ncbi:MAG: substrate-binding domain-containing protein [Phycisphaerae bacterium]
MDGVIGALAPPERSEAARRLHCPAVNVSNAEAKSSFPRVISDDRQVGVMVAEHFLDCGFKQFAFVGRDGRRFSCQREEGFRQRLAQDGHICLAPPPPPLFTPAWADHALAPWLARQSFPLAVMGTNDGWARHVIDAANLNDLRVPDDVAVVGVDNDEVQCELSDLPLSSVEIATDRIGYEAAALLDRLMTSTPSQRQQIQVPGPIPPKGIVLRESSDIFAVEDPDVAQAMSFIRQHAHEPLLVADVVAEVGAGVRSLQMRFRKSTGRTMSQEICNAHVQRAKQLLRDTDWPMLRVALASGFTGAERLSVVFRREVGITPTRYRKQFR